MQTDRQNNRQICGQTTQPTGNASYCTDRQTGRHAGRQTDRQTGRQAGSQAGKQPEKTRTEMTTTTSDINKPGVSS